MYTASCMHLDTRLHSFSYDNRVDNRCIQILMSFYAGDLEIVILMLSFFTLTVDYAFTVTHSHYHQTPVASPEFGTGGHETERVIFIGYFTG